MNVKSDAYKRIAYFAAVLSAALLVILPAVAFGQESESPADGDASLYIVNVHEDIDRDGTPAQIRVITPESSGAPEIMGYAPVEQDGSAFMLLATGIPLMLEVLDGNGGVLAKSEKAVTLAPGEVRGLYRLNEPPGLAPPPPVSKAMPIAVTRDPDTLRPAPVAVRSSR